MAAIVFVWLPKSGSVGHASVSGQGFYVSWWPDPNTPHAQNDVPDGFFFSGIPGRRLSIGEDKKAEKRIPDYASSPIHGLDELAMAKWWGELVGRGATNAAATGKEIRVPKNHATYAVFTNNCSAMVIRCLLIGGAWKNPAFCSVIGQNPVITPRVVKDATEALTGDWTTIFTNLSPMANLLRDAYELISR